MRTELSSIGKVNAINKLFEGTKYTNEPSIKTAVSYGCRQVDEFADEENEFTKVFAITRDEWENL